MGQVFISAGEGEKVSKKKQVDEKRLSFNEIVMVRLDRSQNLIEVLVDEMMLFPKMKVLVRLKRCLLLGEVVGHRFRKMVGVQGMARVVRIASIDDLRIDDENREIESRAIKVATLYVFEHDMGIKPLLAECSHDRRVIQVNFASDNRVDFRHLVNYLQQSLDMKVEMHQLGLRSGTGLMRGLGSCGELLCCSGFFKKFEPVAMKRIRAQGVAPNPKRISGVCGRLYCCLGYEYCNYAFMRKNVARKNKRICSRWGVGHVLEVDAINEEVIVRYDTGEEQRLNVHDIIIDPVESELPESFPIEAAKFYLNAREDEAYSRGLGVRLKRDSIKPLKKMASSRRGKGGFSAVNELKVASSKSEDMSEELVMDEGVKRGEWQLVEGETKNVKRRVRRVSGKDVERERAVRDSRVKGRVRRRGELKGESVVQEEVEPRKDEHNVLGSVIVKEREDVLEVQERQGVEENQQVRERRVGSGKKQVRRRDEGAQSQVRRHDDRGEKVGYQESRVRHRDHADGRSERARRGYKEQVTDDRDGTRREIKRGTEKQKSSSDTQKAKKYHFPDTRYDRPDLRYYRYQPPDKDMKR